MTLLEFYDALNSHDWYFEFSDDHRIWRAGRAYLDRLEVAARESKQHQILFDAFAKHYFSGEPWKTPKAPFPERKDYE